MIFFDIFQALFWSITYILIIIFNIKYKVTAIPALAICLNFGWESVALLNDILTGLWGIGSIIHITWFILDFGIVITYLLFCKKLYFKKIYMVLLYGTSFICFFFIFKYFSNGMLISSFIIDLIMAIEYYSYSIKKFSPINKLTILICIFKLFGDLCAWIYYMKESIIIIVIGFIVLIFNVLCFIKVISRSFDEKFS